MKLPAGFTVPGRTISEQDRRDYVLKLEKNLYGQKQAGRVWYLHLKKNLLKLGFKPSQHDECVFYYGKTIFIVYTDDTILLGPDKEEIDQLVEKLGKTFKIEDQGNLSEYTQSTRRASSRCELSLDPEVATLFGREIGQSNGDILLTICDDSKDKSRPVTFV